MATELAKAYVQIIPSMRGAENEFKKSLGDTSESVGTSSGSTFGKMFKKALAAAGIGIALKKVIGDAFEQGGELQQNLGGTETVFGQFAKRIQDQAVSAYKNMGMSASDYMATANKMGSLFQGSGVEQQKALDMTSQAMQRAADVASVMGVDMGMAMESIAGAAKGNFTMMDNLGVAMNATTLQAYALEKGINFEWKTASNAQKAELAMKMFMDRTSQYAGNFAKESEGTWTGSIGAMKASYQNLMADIMLGNDLGSSLQALTQTVIIFVSKNLIPALGNILKGLPQAFSALVTGVGPQLLATGGKFVVQLGQGIIKNIPAWYESVWRLYEELRNAAIAYAPQMFEVATSLIEQLKTGIEAHLPTLLAKGADTVTNYVTGILHNLPLLIEGGGAVTAQFIGAIIAAFPSILEQGAQLLLNLLNGIIKNLPKITGAIASVIAKILSTIGQNLPKIVQSGIEIIGKLAAGLIRAIPTLVGKIPEIIESIKNAFSSVDWGSVGKNIISGIANGLKNAGSQLWDAVKGVLGNFKDKVLDFFGIHSPSRWGEYVGKMISLGFPQGVEGNLDPFQASMEKIGNIAKKPFGEFEYEMWTAVPANTENTEERGALQRLDRIVEILLMILSGNKEYKIYLKDREVLRALRELGVVVV